MVSAISQLLFMSVKSVTNRPASAPEHMKLQLHQHFDTHMEPSCSLHKIYKPHSPLDRNCINAVTDVIGGVGVPPPPPLL